MTLQSDNLHDMVLIFVKCFKFETCDVVVNQCQYLWNVEGMC